MMMLYDRALRPIGPVQHDVRIGYSLRLNELNTATLILATEDPQVNQIKVSSTFARIHTGARDLGYFRFSSMPKDNHAPQGTVTYELQGAECTLLDKLLEGWHEIGGTGINTRQVLEYILAKQEEKRWVLGRCDFEDYYQYNFQDVTLLEAIMSLGEVLLDDYHFIFDSTVTPWTMHLVRAPDEAKKSLVYRRNMLGFSRRVDGRVVTRLYGRGYGEGDNQLTIASVNDGLPYIEADPATMLEYGVREGVHVDTRQTDPKTLKAHMQKILEGGKKPSASYEATAIAFYRASGESWDDVEIADKVLVVDEIMGKPVTVRATGIEQEDIKGDPGSIRYALDNNQADTAEELNEIRDKIGVHELYSQGATNMYSIQISENADASHPLTMRFYVPGNVLRINSCLIYWQIDRFRTHATLAKAGGGGGRTSSEGGGATVSIPQRITSTEASTGGPRGANGLITNTAGNDYGLSTSEEGSHRHSVEQHTHNLNAHKHSVSSSGTVTGTPDPAVTVANGGGNTGYAGKHSHSVERHTHNFEHWHLVTVTITIPSMEFTLSPHYHEFTYPEHTHPLEYGIYEGERAKSIRLVVDGTEVPEEDVGSERELDVSPYMSKNQEGKVTRSAWHKVEFVPDAMTRITANLFFQVFIQSRGAGDY